MLSEDSLGLCQLKEERQSGTIPGLFRLLAKRNLLINKERIHVVYPTDNTRTKKSSQSRESGKSTGNVMKKGMVFEQ